jgi:MFS family permease
MTAGRFGRAGTLLAVLAVAELMLTVDLSIVNVALPDIRSDLGFGASGLEWVVNGYALTFGGLLLLGGRAADVVGGRPVFLVALGVFTLASLVCGLAASPGMLVAARLVQGAGAGVLSPTTLSILTATFAPGEQRNRALAIWTGVAIGGGAVGAVLGGVVTSGLSWRWIFFVNVPIGLALLAAAARRLPAPAATGAGWTSRVPPWSRPGWRRWCGRSGRRRSPPPGCRPDCWSPPCCWRCSRYGRSARRRRWCRSRRSARWRPATCSAS